MLIYIILTISIISNILLFWYVARLLRKFIFISQNMADLFLITKAFQVFTKSLFSMNSFNGEPIIEELIYKIKEVNEEIEDFRSIFEYSIDTELEEELNAAEEEAQEKH